MKRTENGGGRAASPTIREGRGSSRQIKREQIGAFGVLCNEDFSGDGYSVFSLNRP